MRNREQKIRERISIFQSNKSEKPIKQARDAAFRWSQIANWTAVFWSVIISVILACFPVSREVVFCFNNVLVFCVFLLFFSFILYAAQKASFYSAVVRKIEEEGKPVTGDYETLVAFHLFSSKSIFEFTQALRTYEPQLSSSSRTMITYLHDALRSFFTSADFSVSIYELRSGLVRMVETYKPEQYAGREIENSLLYINRVNGIPIDDSRIKDYYCIRCLRGNVHGLDGKFVLPDWKKILKEFKTTKWNNLEKKNIIKHDNRQKCIDSGFMFNQYFGILFHPNQSTTAFLEIIANDNTSLRSENPLSFASNIKQWFIPCLSVIWPEDS